jgi:nicotinate-nucleotide pyrophosphorylase (carboxylating)
VSDIERLVATALAEDLDERGDVTTAATVPESTVARAAMVARADGVIAGLAAVCATFEAVDPRLAVELCAADGDRVRAGQVVLSVRGCARSVLTAERTALNLVTHASGIATLTARYVAQVAGTGVVIRDTRKTLPGLRALAKAAVAAGGGENHRLSLSDGLLVKDNHVAAAGGVTRATRAALAAAAGAEVQVEVDALDELEEALAAGARSVLLDNFSLDATREAVLRCRACPEPVFVEASGGVRSEVIAAIAATGVDAIAVGALTHSAPALDLGLDVTLVESQNC